MRSVRFLSVAGLVGALFLTNAALASQEFPGELQKKLGMPCAPTCMLCHNDPGGGEDHKNQYYALYWYVILDRTPNATNAREELQKSDTDGDQKNDLDELMAGESPIFYGSAPVCTPQYGCGARVAPAPPNDAIPPEAWLIGTIALGALARFHLRRRAR